MIAIKPYHEVYTINGNGKKVSGEKNANAPQDIQVPFYVFLMGCCSKMIPWVSKEFPKFCPHCGKSVESHQLRDWLIAPAEKVTMSFH